MKIRLAFIAAVLAAAAACSNSPTDVQRNPHTAGIRSETTPPPPPDTTTTNRGGGEAGSGS